MKYEDIIACLEEKVDLVTDPEIQKLVERVYELGREFGFDLGYDEGFTNGYNERDREVEDE